MQPDMRFTGCQRYWDIFILSLEQSQMQCISHIGNTSVRFHRAVSDTQDLLRHGLDSYMAGNTGLQPSRQRRKHRESVGEH
jgi:hypothetical protein